MHLKGEIIHGGVELVLEQFMNTLNIIISLKNLDSDSDNLTISRSLFEQRASITQAP